MSVSLSNSPSPDDIYMLNDVIDNDVTDNDIIDSLMNTGMHKLLASRPNVIASTRVDACGRD